MCLWRGSPLVFMADGQTIAIPAAGQRLVEAFARQEVTDLVRQTLREEGAAGVEGLWGASAPALAAACLPDCPSTLLYVIAHVDATDDAVDDWRLLAGVDAPVFPAWEAIPRETDVTDEVLGERLRILKDLAAARAGHAGPPRVLVATIQALMQPVPSPSHLAENSLELAVGHEVGLAEVRRWLGVRGFEPVDLVLEPGQYAVRGGILDVFPPTSPMPYRVEFFGDEVDSLRTFDPSTQRSDEDRDRVTIAFVPTGKGGPVAPSSTTSLLDYLPPDAWVVWHEPLEIAEVGRSFVARLASPVGVFSYDGVLRASRRFTRLDLASFTSTGGSDAFLLRTESHPRFTGKAETVRTDLEELAEAGRVLLISDNEAERDRVAEIVAALAPAVAARIDLGVGRLSAGFRLVAEALSVVANHELFQRYHDRRRVRRRIETRAIDTWLDLKRGDFVVHVVHGIGRYLGMKTLKAPPKDGLPLLDGEAPRTGKAEEYLVLEYRGKTKVYVPASQIDLVQKYVGGFKGKPRLSRIGGKAWTEKKKRAARAVETLAIDLLRVQATRAAQPGFAYPEDTLWQREFEASFPYPETEDQTAAAQEIKRDMQSARPMDRLLCGDVGYGKTELAARAAFKAVEAGRQVAVLVPTTVLAEQHMRTFRERMADYPVVVEMLSRFQTAGQQADVLDRFRRGKADIVIGTHRLLSKDVEPADLGLLVVDEEQRFGVAHKERLKRMREMVDVLTLTATPIPRTLHMALLGIRDISSLSTPPQDRRAVRTEVCQWDDGRIREAVLRELNREGQVFFVHNRVKTIAGVTDRLRELVPEARTTFAHGQMREHELEARMLDFFAGRVDFFVSTTIIESGLDVPRANTMFIHECDLFGLADLHQLRGRVGRYKHRAYCYLLVPEARPLTPTAVKRLKAIEQYSELGAGFQIAMRDLEIRGAGNILGAEQSGHIAAVGYELYCQLLDRAVARLQGRQAEPSRRADVQAGVEAYLPARYVQTESQRISLYRQLQRAASLEAIDEVAAEIEDMFGDPPPEVRRLVALERVRLGAGWLGVRTLHRKGRDLFFGGARATALEPVFQTAPTEVREAGLVRVLDPTTIVWRLDPEPDAAGALALLEKLLARAGQGD